MMHSHKFFFLILTILTINFFIGAGIASAQYPGFDAPSSRSSGGAALGLVPVESSIDGGAIPVGSSAQVVVLFRNEGAQEVETGLINLYPSSNISAEITLNQCATALTSGAECAIAISVKALQAGSWRLEMLMRHSGRTRLVTATVSGTVEAGADSLSRLSSDIETIPETVNFGSLSSSQTMIESVILRNITSNPIAISDIRMNAADSAGYSLETDCEGLKAGQACIATIVWAPRRKGPATGVLVIKHDGPSAMANVMVEGEYDPGTVEEAEGFPEAVPGKGLLVSSQTEFDFGDDIASASTMTVSLVNIGDVALTLEEIKISGSDNGLNLSNSGCAQGMVLEPIEACPLTVTWSPTRLGGIVDDIQIAHDGARGVLILPVRGEATSTVSQDQKAIVLNKSTGRNMLAQTVISGGGDISASPGTTPARGNTSKRSGSSGVSASVMNASSTLDGLKITSFSANRAIVNGPGGSRLVFDGEPIMLGGVMWDVDIQQNGIEFMSDENRILLLFDRSLSSVSRTSANTSASSTSDGS
ncbi:MAG: choice-of-anchor D domain-containing protein [Alphaproteobacteria bacterium]